MIKYKVEYYTESGSPSDNQFIGIYDTQELAIDAKNRYIRYQCGALTEQEFISNHPIEDLSNWKSSFKDLQRQVYIETVQNF